MPELLIKQIAKRIEMKIFDRKKWLVLFPFFLFFTILTVYVSNNIFFWDTVLLGAKHASFYYDTNFQTILMPDSLDCGHIPFFGAYLALIWVIFSKSLLISHLAMLPFLYGIVYQLYIFAKRYISFEYIIPALILILADTTLLGQSILVSPDIPLVFLFFLGLNSVLDNKRIFLSISILGLFMVSMRGMMLAMSLLALDIIINIQFTNLKLLIKKLLIQSIAYLPALFLFIAYYGYHYIEKGWLVTRPHSPWSGNFEVVSLFGVLKNSGILIWRLIDYGRIFIWITTFILIIKHLHVLLKDKKAKQIILIFCLSMCSILIVWLCLSSMSCHRYLLPEYLILAVFAAYLIFEKIKSHKIKYVVFTFTLLGLLSGNFWIYPEKIAQGWDSTLAQLHYYKTRNEIMSYIKEQNIPLNQIGCAFPNIEELKYLDLSNSSESFNIKDNKSIPYILYSNVYNDFSDAEIDSLKQNYILIKESSECGVYMKLYAKKK